MPNNIPITGDDPVWKREVDKELQKLRDIIQQQQITINYLKGRVK